LIYHTSTIADGGGGDEVLYLLLQSNTSDSDTRTPTGIQHNISTLDANFYLKYTKDVTFH